MELIDKNTLISDLNEVMQFCQKRNAALMASFISLTIEIVRRCPIVEAKPVIHSKWVSIDNSPHKSSVKRCDDCGASFNLLSYCKNDYRYCPYCGAKMDEEAES